MGGSIMRKIIISLSALFALLVVLTISSCEKAIISDEDDNGGGDANGNLRVSVSQIEKTPFATTRTAVSEVCSRLNFVIYDEDGARLKYVNQQLGKNDDFGTANFQLEEGTYQLVVLAHSANGNPTTTNIAKIQFTNSQGFTDTFLYYKEVTIGEEGADLNVSLDRIVSLCRFVLTDDYPADVNKIRFQYKGGSGAFDATTGFGSVNSTQTLYFDAAEGQKTFDLYTFLHDTEGTIHLLVSAYDADDNVLYERTFDVPMEQNHITWLTGAFFSGSGASSTTVTGVTVNTDWAGEKHITF